MAKYAPQADQREVWVKDVLAEVCSELANSGRAKVYRASEPVLKEVASRAYPLSHLDDAGLEEDPLGLSELRGQEPRVIKVFFNALRKRDMGWLCYCIKKYEEARAGNNTRRLTLAVA